MAVITDLATIAAATAAKYQLTTWTKDGRQFALLAKPMGGNSGGNVQEVRAHGEDVSSLTVAKTNALNALNAQRRHHYAGSPGTASGATIVASQHGDTPTADATW